MNTNTSLRIAYKHALGSEGRILPLHDDDWELLLTGRVMGEPILRRIVACVNALEGVTIEELESGAFKAEIARTLQQRDELLAALVPAVLDLESTYEALKQGTPVVSIGQFQCLTAAKAAIAKCKGGV